MYLIIASKYVSRGRSAFILVYSDAHACLGDLNTTKPWSRSSGSKRTILGRFLSADTRTRVPNRSAMRKYQSAGSSPKAVRKVGVRNSHLGPQKLHSGIPEPWPRL